MECGREHASFGKGVKRCEGHDSTRMENAGGHHAPSRARPYRAVLTRRKSDFAGSHARALLLQSGGASPSVFVLVFFYGCFGLPCLFSIDAQTTLTLSENNRPFRAFLCAMIATF